MNVYVPSSNNSLCPKLLLWPLNAWGVLPGAADPPLYGPDWSCFVHCPAGLGREVQIESRLGSPCHVALAFFPWRGGLLWCHKWRVLYRGLLSAWSRFLSNKGALQLINSDLTYQAKSDDGNV